MGRFGEKDSGLVGPASCPVFIALSVALLGAYKHATTSSEEQRAHQAAVQAYLDEMGQLLLDKDTHYGNLRRRRGTNHWSGRELDGVRNLRSIKGPSQIIRETVMGFLHETSLIDKDNPVIRLTRQPGGPTLAMPPS